MFTLTHKDKNTKARTGILKTPHGEFPTPFFMPVATKGAVKYLTPEHLREIGVKNIIANSLLLSLNPGVETIKKAGGIHKFLNFDGCIFTDSGGFQILSDYLLIKSEHDRVIFKSPREGTQHVLTPTQAIDIQLDLGCDVMMPLDDVPKYGLNHRQVKSSMIKTHTWARQELEHFRKKTEGKKNPPLLFGIIQGGIYPDLREISAKFITSLGFDGIALGSLAIGETRDEMFTAINACLPYLPEDKLIYVLGLGSPPDIVKAVSLGIDCFDSIYPTRNARHGHLFTMQGHVKILRKEYEKDLTPVDKDCPCPLCKNYTKAYIHHLLGEKEGVAYILATQHNITFMTRLFERMREEIKKDTMNKFVAEFTKSYK